MTFCGLYAVLNNFCVQLLPVNTCQAKPQLNLNTQGSQP